MVLCPDPDEADKCRRLIRTGHPGFDLAPIVIDSSGPPGGGEAGGPYLTVFTASMGGIIEKIHDEGIAEGEAKALLRLMSARGLAPSQAQQNRVTSCTDPAQLDLWFDRAVTAATAAEVFTD